MDLPRDQLFNAAFFSAGLVMGSANKIRHLRQGYVRPRPFSPADLSRSIDHAIAVVDRLEDRGGIQWDGKRVLELGPGADLATGAVMLHRGALEYRAVDVFDNLYQAHPQLYDCLERRLGGRVDRGRLGFTRTDFPRLPDLSGRYDLIVSNATLEHVSDVGGLFLRLRRFAADGSQMVHHVDAQTHMRWIKDRDPLNILRYPDGIYRRLLDFPGAPNRLRSRDFEGLARAAGWRAPKCKAARLASRQYLERLQVAARFRNREDLEAMTFTLVCSV